MIELAFDIASGATYKFNTAFVGAQVRTIQLTPYILHLVDEAFV